MNCYAGLVLFELSTFTCLKQSFMKMQLNNDDTNNRNKRLFQLLFELQMELDQFSCDTINYRQELRNELEITKRNLEVLMQRILTDSL